MPIYEYQCKKCGQFEVMQKITESPLKRCPTCRAKVTKLMSNTSFQLKGTGWYVTDYGRKGSTSKESGSESKDSKAEKSTATSDAKSSTPDTKETKDTKSSKTETKASGSKEAAAA